MNRSDEIQAVARDIAQRVTRDPEQRNAMTDDLIKLVALVVAAVGKSVAIAGESEMNELVGAEFELDTESIDFSTEEIAAKEAEWEAERSSDAAKYHGMYLTGEQIQEGARWVENEACGADLERYERDGLKPVWVPQAACEGFRTCTGIHNQRGEHLRDRPVPKFTGCPDPSDDGELDDGWEGPYDESFEDLYREAPDDAQPTPELFAPGAEAYYRKVLGLDGTCGGCGHAMATHGTHLGCLFEYESGRFCTCEHNRCNVAAVGGGACVKAAGHRPPGSGDPHVFI